MFGRGDRADVKKIRIERVSAWSIAITIALGVLLVAISAECTRQFANLQSATNEYIDCEKAARQLQEGSDYLAEQVRLYTVTNQREYMDNYFQEAEVTRRQEQAFAYLEEKFADTDSVAALKTALDCTKNLSYTDRYAMRLVAEATLPDQDSWPEAIKSVGLHDSDKSMTDTDKVRKAQQLVCNSSYQNVRNEVNENVAACTASLIMQTQNRQNNAASVFSDLYLKFELCVAVLILLVLMMCMMVRHLIVKPLLLYGKSIREEVIFPVVGSAELQNLAVTYNKVYLENQETQKLIRHEAEHDALTDALNRGAFEKILSIYEKGNSPFAMIICDVDIFKSVNDTYGHATGDAVLKKVAELLAKTFRAIDYVFRIGGDEFAVIMVDMTTDLAYTIKGKIDSANEILSHPDDGLPAISLSVGVAFTDRKDPGESIFKDADHALYHVKQHGKHNCAFYGETAEPCAQPDAGVTEEAAKTE